MKRVLVCGLVPDVGGLEKIVVDFYNNVNTDEFEFDFKVQKMLNLVIILKNCAKIQLSFIEYLS